MSTEGKIYLYPKWLRAWHGLNALGIIVLIVTGINMQYASPDFHLMPFELGMTLHNIAGVVVSLSYLLFFFGNLFTKNGKHYRIDKKGIFKSLYKQMRYYAFGMFKKETSPFPVTEKRKFNPLQKYSYIAVMYLLVPLVIVSGVALLFPEMIIADVYGVSGMFLTAILHASVGFLISVFLIVHLYVASVGKSPFKNYRSIITGWHE